MFFIITYYHINHDRIDSQEDVTTISEDSGGNNLKRPEDTLNDTAASLRLTYVPPTNVLKLHAVRRMDDFLDLKDKKKLELESMLEKIQKKNLEVVGPMTRLWSIGYQQSAR